MRSDGSLYLLRVFMLGALVRGSRRLAAGSMNAPMLHWSKGGGYLRRAVLGGWLALQMCIWGTLTSL